MHLARWQKHGVSALRASMRTPSSFAETPASASHGQNNTRNGSPLLPTPPHGSALLGEHTARTVHVPNMQAPVVVPIDDLIQGYIGGGSSARGSGLPVNRILVVPVTVGTVPVSVGTVPPERTGKGGLLTEGRDSVLLPVNTFLLFTVNNTSTDHSKHY